ncbi:Carbohydrate sulfotransferase 8 [Bulinus truncatus]|nr:Carbohydrate sulfotransferase 8 [Bulinus truncatus]
MLQSGSAAHIDINAWNIEHQSDHGNSAIRKRNNPSKGKESEFRVSGLDCVGTLVLRESAPASSAGDSLLTEQENTFDVNIGDTGKAVSPADRYCHDLQPHTSVSDTFNTVMTAVERFFIKSNVQNYDGNNRPMETAKEKITNSNALKLKTFYFSGDTVLKVDNKYILENYSPGNKMNYSLGNKMNEDVTVQSTGPKGITCNTNTSATPVTDRNVMLRQRCGANGIRLLSSVKKKRSPRFHIAPLILSGHKPKVFFCPLAKVGSTFFTRYLMTLTKSGQDKSPYSIKVKEAKRSGLENFDTFKNDLKKLHFLDTSFKFLFCRNPYTRLFSAYVDKLYSPNPYYWKYWGRKAPLMKKTAEQKCGVGVSFPLFVKLVIRLLHRTDMHVMPMSTLCRLCDVNWDFVGLMEDSVKDIDALSRHLNVSASYQHEPEYKMSSAVDAIFDSTNDVFRSWQKDVKKCMSMSDASRIIWRKLQIRGIIYANLSFPFSVNETNVMTAEKFQKACIQAAEISTNTTILRIQKNTAFREAYQMVEKADIEALQRIYSQDLSLLGYPLWPSVGSSVASNATKNILNWRQPWIV